MEINRTKGKSVSSTSFTTDEGVLGGGDLVSVTRLQYNSIPLEIVIRRKEMIETRETGVGDIQATTEYDNGVDGDVLVGTRINSPHMPVIHHQQMAAEKTASASVTSEVSDLGDHSSTAVYV